MLDYNDLQAISQLLESHLAPIKSDIGILKSDVETLKTDAATLKSDVATLKNDTATQKSDVEELKERSTRVEMILENEISRNIALILENQTKAAEEHQRLNRVDETLETHSDEIFGLKEAVKELQAV